jgi:hypothetical protein
LKKFVTEECPTWRCVVVMVVETVPVKVYRKVPCGSGPGCAVPPNSVPAHVPGRPAGK